MRVLLDSLDFNLDYARDEFKKSITKDKKVLVVPYSFHEERVVDDTAWKELYDNKDGKLYSEIVAPFTAFGIKDNNVDFLNYYSDDTVSSIAKIRNSDIILFTGGFPEKIVHRLAEMELLQEIDTYKGIIMGWSAGAMIQCEDYFISPDEDYPEYQYHKGLKGISDFAVEVHFQGSKEQIESIERYMKDTGKEVYVTEKESAIVVTNEGVKLLGKAQKYSDYRKLITVS